MKRKAFVLAAALALIGAVEASARSSAAIGGEFGLPLVGGLPDSTAMLTFKLPKFPPVFGLGAYIPKAGGQASLALTADWWLAQGHLFSFVDYYLGPGVFVGISQGAQLGLRVPIGLDAYPIKPLECFVEFAPALYLLDSSGAVSIPNFGLQAGFGIRFWF